MKLYHNPRCSKSRQAKELLKGQDVEIVEYLKHPLSVEELRDICTVLNILPHKLLRTGEPIFKELTQGQKPDDEQALMWMHEHPILMERPIFIKEGKAVIGRPPERVLEL